MSTKFKDVNWEENTPFAVLQSYGFFPYSGADGDLFRKHGFAGLRVSVYGRYLVRIQEKNSRGTWVTKHEWRTDRSDELPPSDIAEFDQTLNELTE